MPKLAYPTYAYLEEIAGGEPECKRILDGMRVEGRRIRNLYRFLGWSPVILRLWGRFAKGLRDEVQISPVLRELMICRIAQLKRAGYALGQHRRLAVSEGVSVRQLDDIQNWKHSDRFSGDERLFLQLADELGADGQASAESLNALCSEFGERAAVEAVVTGCFYLCVAAVLNSLDPDPEHDER